METKVPRRRRVSAISLAAGLALFAMLLPAAAGLASAHTPSASLTCNADGHPVLQVDLTNYSSSSTNLLWVTIDGVNDATYYNYSFGTTFHRTWNLSPSTSAHIAKVVVLAGDDLKNAHGYSPTYNLSHAACQQPTATPTATETATTTATPFETIQGETATADPSTTPPPTSTGRGSGSSTTPLLALLICLAFGGLGIAAVETQRRSIRR